ncbi:MAG: hypothetical protein ACE37J_09395 [Pikeienuella sp.]|uniref:hypothetical protein n=1 Tax=Pikeienuella sp. TaxID=2831957 RepID=UPI003918A179
MDLSRPPGAVEALRRCVPHQPVEIFATASQSPASAIADAFGTAPTLEALLSPVLDQEVAVLRLYGGDLPAWSVFLERFAAARASGRSGPALLVVDPPSGLGEPAGALLASWRTGLRRGDLVIWAEEHLPAAREGVAADVAVALAVDLCGWRLDLGAAFVQASLEDLADPVAWLSRRAERPIFSGEAPCPLALLAEERSKELHQRIWKAQLMSLFPELESSRLAIVETYRVRLHVDEHLLGLGVRSIEEIEFGALRFQLRRSLSRPEADRLDALTRARNALAHRKPVDPQDALQILRA